MRRWPFITLAAAALTAAGAVLAQPNVEASGLWIRNLEADVLDLARPLGEDVYLVYVTFDYHAENADVAALVVTTRGPAASTETATITGLRDLGIEGRSGRARVTLAYRSDHPLGVYQYRLRLVDSGGRKGQEAALTVELHERDEPRLSVWELEPSSGRPGELITITGVGFDSSFVEANQVSIAGLPLEISQVSDRQIIALLPDGAVSGRVAVSNGRGTALSSREFAVVPSVHIAGTGHTTVRPLETIKLTAVVTGLVDTAVDWHVDDIPGGSEVLGTIDAFGNYTAPAVPPAAASVRISATSAANPSLRAAQVIALSAPLPLVAGDTVNALTGGRIHGRNGLLTIDVPPAALANDAKVTALHAEHPAWGADADIEGVPDGYVPVAAFEVRLAHEEELREPIGFSLLLPVQTPPQTEHVILIHDGRVYERTGEARVDVSADGFSLTGSLGAVNFRALVVRTAASFEIPGLVPTLEIVPPVEVTGIEVPVTIIEEGMTLPVLVEGAGFVPGATRVSAAEPAVGQHLEFGPVVVSADGAELGFTLRIKPIRTLDRGQTLPVSFRVEILNPSGQTSWVLETDANQFQINGLPELVVCEGERGNRSDLFTIDGQRIDRAVSQSQRLSTLVVCEGFVLGIGREVEDIEADGIVWDLSGLAGFEDAFGRLAWVTEQQRRSHSVSIFQPEHRLVFFDVTGPVDIRGTIYFSGMRGGENAQVVRARGGGRGLHGGLASGTLSGGRGGDGGITSGGATTDGQRAGNNVTPDLGIGRGADGRLSGNQPAGFGSRFDPINVSFDDFFKAGAEVFASAFSPKASFITVAKAAGNFAAEMVHLSSTTTIRLAPQPLIVSGQGGHPGSRPTAAPELIDDRRLVPGTGGGGGASAYTETVLFGLITLRTDHRTGGAGAGGGGAAGALRITSGTSLEIGPNGSLLGIGGRGGFGESHISLASTGGGGGGGAGGVAKLQAPQLANRGLIDLSGGERAGAILAQSSFPAPFIVGGRIQVLSGLQHGGILYYGHHRIGEYAPTVHVLWPTGRLRASLQVPHAARIRGIGTADFGILSGLLILTDDRRVLFTSSVDYYSGSPHLMYVGELINLRSIRDPRLAGFIPTDIAQSPFPPRHIYISGVSGTGTVAESQVHEFDVGGNYLGMPFRVTTRDVSSGICADQVGHLKNIDFLSNGQLVGLMSTQCSALHNGVHAIDVTNGSYSLLKSDNATAASMSVLRGDHEDILYIARWQRVVGGDGAPGPQPTRIERWTTAGQHTGILSLAHETISSPGEPGLLRVDGGLPGSNPATLKHDGRELPNLRYDGQPATFDSPVIGSFAAAAGVASGLESLVVDTSRLTVYGQGGEPGELAAIYRNGRPTGQIVPVDAQGRFTAVVALAPGFNTVWVQTSRGGSVHELLRRHALYVD